MQHYGHLRDEAAGVDLTEKEALKRIEGLLKDCRRDYQIAKAWMKRLYADEGEAAGDEADEEGDKGKQEEAKEKAEVKK